MSRNFGLGSRDMASAGKMALNNAAHSGGISFQLLQLMATGGNHSPHGRKMRASRKWKTSLKSLSKNMAKSWRKKLAAEIYQRPRRRIMLAP